MPKGSIASLVIRFAAESAKQKAIKIVFFCTLGSILKFASSPRLEIMETLLDALIFNSFISSGLRLTVGSALIHLKLPTVRSLNRCANVQDGDW